MRRGGGAALFVAALLVTCPAYADWVDDYEAGLKAAQQEQWSVVVQKMSAAIAAKPRENRQERTYGNIFVAYHPYYYRGVAHFELGEYQKAIDDLERATGVGRVRLQSAEALITRAQQRLQPVVPPPPPPSTTTIAPPPPVVIPPAADPLIEQNRQRAERAIADAERARTAATRQMTATVRPQTFSQGADALSDAMTRRPTARTAADWQRVGELADQARGHFEAAAAQAAAEIAKQQTTETKAAEDVLAETKTRVRRALEDYFEGRFSQSAQRFEQLARGDQRDNALVWTFLGAAQYSAYYLEGERSPELRRAAEASFRRARALRPGMTELPADYFSPRIRNFYKSIR